MVYQCGVWYISRAVSSAAGSLTTAGPWLLLILEKWRSYYWGPQAFTLFLARAFGPVIDRVQLVALYRNIYFIDKGTAQVSSQDRVKNGDRAHTEMGEQEPPGDDSLISRRAGLPRKADQCRTPANSSQVLQQVLQ